MAYYYNNNNNARRRRVFMVGINQTNFFDRPIVPSISSYQAFHGVLETIHGSYVRNCEIYIVNVIPPPPLQFPQGQCMDGGRSSYESTARQNNDANVLVQQLVNICYQHQITSHPLVIQSDNVGAALVQASENTRADVLVIGNPGRDVDPIESVSFYCRGNAHTDLWVVPRRLEDMSSLRIHIDGVLALPGWVIPTPEQRRTVYRRRILDSRFD